ncbi:MAG: glycosyltransferase [Pseudomonadales bacterium]
MNRRRPKALSAADARADGDLRKQRICLVIPAHWEAFMGGSQYQAKFLVEALAETGDFEIFYLTRRAPAGFTPHDHQIVAVKGIPGLKRYTDVFDSVDLLRKLRVIRPDVVYQRASSGFTGVCAYYAKHAGIRSIWHVASDVDVIPAPAFEWLKVHHHLEKRFIEYGLRHASTIVTQTRTQSDLMARHYGRAADWVIPNYQPMPEACAPKPGPLRVVWLANVKPTKQPHLFVQLASALGHRSDVEFVMVGAPDADETRMAGVLSELERVPNLSYLGPLPQAEANAVLARSHLLVNTSTAEGYSNTFIQAWQRGLAVVSLNSNPDSVLDDGSIGYCANGDFGRLVRRVDLLLSQPEVLSSMGDRAVRFARSQFGRENLERLVQVVAGR